MAARKSLGRKSLDLEAARTDPAGNFDAPGDIVRRKDLSRETKIELLREWEREARALAVAEEEGMTGGEESMLARVLRALRELGVDTEELAEAPGHGTKHDS